MFFVVKPLIVLAGKMRYCPSLRARLLDIGQLKRNKNEKKNEANTMNFKPSSWNKLGQYSKDLLYGQKENLLGTLRSNNATATRTSLKI